MVDFYPGHGNTRVFYEAAGSHRSQPSGGKSTSDIPSSTVVCGLCHCVIAHFDREKHLCQDGRMVHRQPCLAGYFLKRFEAAKLPRPPSFAYNRLKEFLPGVLLQCRINEVKKINLIQQLAREFLGRELRLSKFLR